MKKNNKFKKIYIILIIFIVFFVIAIGVFIRSFNKNVYILNKKFSLIEREFL